MKPLPGTERWKIARVRNDQARLDSALEEQPNGSAHCDWGHFWSIHPPLWNCIAAQSAENGAQSQKSAPVLSDPHP
jgi:hypothetical protein